ncbi:myopalladin isoform X2 [Conger conger]|uniref:myopalladin isoform X2 n=1 Tax=Conger conger TaxID=82655 RepID=UPI002A5A6C0C|nr:myopalladin isoform X2 [Conger conger]
MTGGAPRGAVGITKRLPTAVRIYSSWTQPSPGHACNMAQVQKKTTTMSLTISSCSRESSSSTVVQQRHSSLVQPLHISPQRTQSPSYSQHYSGNGGVAPTFVKCLHDISTVKGQLVVLECRIRGTPPLQVLWYREEEQIEDSADFRILRKKASSASVPEELCTLVITEAYPEDSGMFKCIAGNQYGTVSCSALLEVYSDLDEVLSNDEPSGGSVGQDSDDFPSFLRDATEIPPPEWPSSPEEEMTPLSGASPELQEPSKTAAEPYSPAGESNHSSISRGTPEACSPSTPPPAEDRTPSPELPRTSHSQAHSQAHSSQQDPGGNMSVADLPTFTPTLYPPTAFNYERPRHFIQSQPHFQAPSYESVQQSPSSYPNGSTSSSALSSPISPTPTSSSVGSPRDPLPAPLVCPPDPPSLPPPPTPMRISVTLIPKSPQNPQPKPQPQPQPQPQHPSTAAFLSSILPCQTLSQPNPAPAPAPASAPLPKPTSPIRSPQSPPPPPAPMSLPANNSPPSATPPSLSPSLPKPTATLQQSVAPSSFVSLPASYRGSTNSLPRPILKKTAPRPVSTDEEIQGSKDALIQDLEKKLRCKEARRRNNSQLSYEERMARRLLGPDSAASVFDLENSPDSQSEQPDSPEGRHTGGIWSAQHSGTDGNEGPAIQEKCYAPRFLQVPQDLMVEEGRFCRIDFKVGGLPIPDVSWYLNGQAIRPNEYHKMLVCEKGLHSFIIEVVTVDHAGVYECVAKNRAGESRFSMRLDVIAQEMLRPPTFVQKMQNSRALEGDTVRLECTVVASPPPQLYWKKDKEMFHIDPNRMSMYQDNTGRLCLLINRVEKADAGWYTLSAINEAGMSNCNARLDVGTRLNKAAPAGKHLKVRPALSSLSVLSAESTPEKTAPLFESDEL